MKDLKREFRITFEDKYKNGVLHCFDNYEDAEKKFVEVCHKFIDDRKEYIKDIWIKAISGKTYSLYEFDALCGRN